MVVHKVFTSIDLMLLFYRVYLCLILDLRRTKNAHNCAYFKLQQQFFIRYKQFQFCQIFKRLYHTSFKLNIVNYERALNPMRGSQWSQTIQLHFISQFMQNAEFLFPSWLTPQLDVWSVLCLTHFLSMSVFMGYRNVALRPIWGEWPSGLRHYPVNWKDHSSNPMRCLAGLWDPTLLRGSW